MAESRELNEVVDAAIEQSLLGGPRKYTRSQVCELSGVPVERARKLWVALGFAAAESDDEVVFTDADVAAIRTFAALGAATAANEQSQVTAARTLGQAMARLAEWQADLLTREVEDRIANDGDAFTLINCEVHVSQQHVRAHADVCAARRGHGGGAPNHRG